MHPLNPEAGASQHVPDDARALAVVERASDWCERAFPYLWWRYGERGYRFILSDSAYLVAMAELPSSGLSRHLTWTADLLAQRGMPRWLLELHTRQLGRMLVRGLPDRPELGERLIAAAESLGDRRRARISPADFRANAERFAADLRLGRGRLWRGFGSILTAAVADERDGLEHAVESVCSWACDHSRFGPVWIAAVRSCVEAARELPDPSASTARVR